MKFQELQNTFEKYMLLRDKGVVRVVVATIIANQLKQKPVWLVIVGPSSGGKTEVLEKFSKIQKNNKKLVEVVSKLGPNSFISGAKTAENESPSLLDRINNNGGMIFLKDMTSLISMRQDEQGQVLSQMREIYDGVYNRALGTGLITWEGKIGILGASTPSIYTAMQDFGDMGERLIMYNFEQEDREKVNQFVIDKEYNNIDGGKEMEEKATEYTEGVLKYLQENEISTFDLPKEMGAQLGKIASFSTEARSPVKRNYKEEISDVPLAEMPMRMTKALFSLARGLYALNKAEGYDGLTEIDHHILYKIAIDSIPPSFRSVMKILSEYPSGGNIEKIASLLCLPMTTTQRRLEHLNARNIITASRATHTEIWTMKKKYREIMCEFDDVVESSQLSIPGSEVDDDFIGFS